MKDKWWLSDPATWKGTWQEDWRIMGQEGYLKDKKLQHMKFNRAMCTEDNDQCDFCYSLLDGDNQDASYAYFEPITKSWICERCYKDFKDHFNWITEEANN